MACEIARALKHFVDPEALPEPGSIRRRSGRADGLMAALAPRDKALLERRMRCSADRRLALAASRQAGRPGRLLSFLRDIGYLVADPGPFTVGTENVDAEIATIAGPQLVVPVTNARYALNAGNARWGSLYDALYGTDAIPEDDGATRGGGFNQVRGARVVAQGAGDARRGGAAGAGSHADVTGYAVQDGALAVR